MTGKQIAIVTAMFVFLGVAIYTIALSFYYTVQIDTYDRQIAKVDADRKEAEVVLNALKGILNAGKPEMGIQPLTEVLNAAK
ncbi:MAG: hypothetical protein N3A38_06610, partial [Planctomycetota bacterium]|nr:hypothetical protein [Planctomycetota bacterium]